MVNDFINSFIKRANPYKLLNYRNRLSIIVTENGHFCPVCTICPPVSVSQESFEFGFPGILPPVYTTLYSIFSNRSRPAAKCGEKQPLLV